MEFSNIFNGKKVIVTGHTGFKGSWLSLWLNILGAKVVGLSINIPTYPSHFKAIKLQNKINHCKMDIRNLKLLKKASETLSIPLIASGGVGQLSHFKDGVILEKANALLAASVFHFGEVSIQDVKNYLSKAEISVRND